MDEYQRAAVTVIPSTTDAEASPIVLAEANACGRPVVASRIGGIPDFRSHVENGWLTRPGDPEDLARTLVAALADPERASEMGGRGRKIALAERDWDELSRKTETIYLEAIGR